MYRKASSRHSSCGRYLVAATWAFALLLLAGCDKCKTAMDCSAGQICVNEKCKSPDKGDSETNDTETASFDEQETDSDSAHPDDSDSGIDTHLGSDSDSESIACTDAKADCPSPTDCRTYACEAGKCVVTRLSGEPCHGDDDACTEEMCVNGECVATPLSGVSCESDENACTNDMCIDGACTHRPLSGNACEDDGNPCTEDICEQGVCGVPLNGTSCESDGNPCTEEICRDGACDVQTLPDGRACDDGLWCNGSVDRCVDGSCVPREGSAPCVASSPCIDVSCGEPKGGDTEGTCDQVLLSGVSCDDGLFCNGQESCDEGVCTSASPPCTESVGLCMENLCDETRDDCVSTPVTDGQPCPEQDGLLCNGVERCEGGQCIAGTPYCTVFNDCTQNICIEGEAGEEPTCEGVEPANDGMPCSTSVVCDGTGNRYCLDGVCAHGETPACAPLEQDGNLCTRYAFCNEEHSQPLCQYKQDDTVQFLSIACGETIPFETLITNNEVSAYEGTACSGNFDGGEEVFVLGVESGDYTVTLEVDRTTMDAEELRMFRVTDPCDAVNTCIDSSTTTLSGTQTGGASAPVIVIDGANGNRGRGTLTLTCG